MNGEMSGRKRTSKGECESESLRKLSYRRVGGKNFQFTCICFSGMDPWPWIQSLLNLALRKKETARFPPVLKKEGTRKVNGTSGRKQSATKNVSEQVPVRLGRDLE